MIEQLRLGSRFRGNDEEGVGLLSSCSILVIPANAGTQ